MEAHMVLLFVLFFVALLFSYFVARIVDTPPARAMAGTRRRALGARRWG
jgi:hypothetical protein